MKRLLGDVSGVRLPHGASNAFDPYDILDPNRDQAARSSILDFLLSVRWFMMMIGQRLSLCVAC